MALARGCRLVKSKIRLQNDNKTCLIHIKKQLCWKTYLPDGFQLCRHLYGIVLHHDLEGTVGLDPHHLDGLPVGALNLKLNHSVVVHFLNGFLRFLMGGLTVNLWSRWTFITGTAAVSNCVCALKSRWATFDAWTNEVMVIPTSWQVSLRLRTLPSRTYSISSPSISTWLAKRSNITPNLLVWKCLKSRQNHVDAAYEWAQKLMRLPIQMVFSRWRLL